MSPQRDAKPQPISYGSLRSPSVKTDEDIELTEERVSKESRCRGLAAWLCMVLGVISASTLGLLILLYFLCWYS
jgi:hypothetical protein